MCGCLAGRSVRPPFVNWISKATAKESIAFWDIVSKTKEGNPVLETGKGGEEMKGISPRRLVEDSWRIQRMAFMATTDNRKIPHLSHIVDEVGKTLKQNSTELNTCNYSFHLQQKTTRSKVVDFQKWLN